MGPPPLYFKCNRNILLQKTTNKAQILVDIAH